MLFSHSISFDRSTESTRWNARRSRRYVFPACLKLPAILWYFVVKTCLRHFHAALDFVADHHPCHVERLLNVPQAHPQHVDVVANQAGVVRKCLQRGYNNAEDDVTLPTKSAFSRGSSGCNRACCNKL